MTDTPQARLEAAYGFRFPDDFFQFWAWVQTLPNGEKTLMHLSDIRLEAPFDVFKDDYDPKTNLHKAARHYNDPPEFFRRGGWLALGLLD